MEVRGSTIGGRVAQSLYRHVQKVSQGNSVSIVTGLNNPAVMEHSLPHTYLPASTCHCQGMITYHAPSWGPSPATHRQRLSKVGGVPMREVCQQRDGRLGFDHWKGSLVTIISLTDHLQSLQHTSRITSGCPLTVGGFFQYSCHKLGIQPSKARV